MSGDHLVPVKETQIELRKEILKISAEGKYHNWAKIEVDFTFFNPGEEKTEIVGFVYSEPEGDFNGEPYLKDFSVNVNGQDIDHKNAKIDKDKLKDFQKKQDRAFYFPVTFKKGENKILHEYQYKTSGGIDVSYDIPYVLTTGTMWANGQIDDFTLIIDMGEKESYSVPEKLEKKEKVNWVVEDGKISSSFKGIYEERIYVSIGQNTKPLTFKKKDFKPSSELSVIKFSHIGYNESAKERYFPQPEKEIKLSEDEAKFVEFIKGLERPRR